MISYENNFLQKNKTKEQNNTAAREYFVRAWCPYNHKQINLMEPV